MYTTHCKTTPIHVSAYIHLGSLWDAVFFSSDDLHGPSPWPSHDDRAHAFLIALVGDGFGPEDSQDSSEVPHMEG